MSDPTAKLGAAAALRARAAQARRLGQALGSERDRDNLLEYAANLDQQANAIEAEAPPVVTRHQNPVQVQQAQVTPTESDGQPEDSS